MTTPPREGFRAVLPATLEVREKSKGEGDGKTLTGHFAVFNRWTEIDSWVEGHFLERIAPGAFSKTFRETTPKVLFQHGRDNVVGDRPLGTIKELREDGDQGAYYEVDLFDTSYNADLIPGLRAGVYGASFRFRSTREEFDPEPERTSWNPEGIPVRTIKEAQVSEFGPVTWPAYADATAGLRSFSDDLVLRSIERDPERFARFVGTQDELLHAVVKNAKKSTVIDLGERKRSFPRVTADLKALAHRAAGAGEGGLNPADTSALTALLARLAAADAAFDPIVDAIVGADMALDDAQATLADVLGVENPDDDAADDANDAGRSKNAPVETFSIRQILDAGFSESTTVMIVDDSERDDEHDLEEDAPVEDAAPLGTSETRRVEDPDFIKIGNLMPIPRNRKVA